MRRIRDTLACALLCSVVIDGYRCAAPTEAELADADESSVEPILLAEVSLNDGRVVSFLEAEPGFVFLRERGKIGSEPLIKRPTDVPLDPVAVYEHLSGRRAPDTLTAAVALTPIDPGSAGESAEIDEIEVPSSAATDAAGPPGEIGTIEQGLSNDLSKSEFISKFCPPSRGSEYFRWVDVTGRGNLVRSDRRNLESAVMAERGTVHFVAKYRPWYTWRNLVDVDVRPGWYEHVFMTQNLDFDARATVDEASDDTYHMCTEFSR